MGLTTIILMFVMAFCNYQGTRKWAQALDELKQRGEPYTMAQLQKEYGQIEDNAAKYYLAAAELAGDEELSAEEKAAVAKIPLIGQGQQMPELGAPLPPEQLAASEKYLAGKTAIFPLLAQADEMPRCHYPVDFSEGISTRLPHLIKIRQVARILALKCAVELQKNQPAAAVKTIAQIFRLADSLSEEPILVSQLVRIAVTGTAVQSLERALSSGDLAPAELAVLASALDRRKIDPGDEARFCFVGERAFGIAVFMSLRGGTALNLHDLNGAEGTLGQSWVRWILRSSGWLDNQFCEYVAFMNGVIDCTKLPPFEGRAKLRAQARRLDERIKRGTLSQARLFLLGMLCPAVDRAYDGLLKQQQTLALARTALAIERFRQAEKRFPETLAELTPTYLAEIPRDYFRSAGNLQYVRKTGGEAAEGPDFSGYLIYSVGPDGEDNHGHVNSPKKCYQGKSGSDLVFRRIERAVAGETF